MVWWIVFLVGRFGSFAAPSFELFHRYRVDGFNVSNGVLVTGSVLTAIAAVLAILVVRRITSRQVAGVAPLATGPLDRWGGASASPAPPVPPRSPSGSPGGGPVDPASAGRAGTVTALVARPAERVSAVRPGVAAPRRGPPR